jgi:hypothetical protein
MQQTLSNPAQPPATEFSSRTGDASAPAQTITADRTSKKV